MHAAVNNRRARWEWAVNLSTLRDGLLLYVIMYMRSEVITHTCACGRRWKWCDGIKYTVFSALQYGCNHFAQSQSCYLPWRAVWNDRQDAGATHTLQHAVIWWAGADKWMCTCRCKLCVRVYWSPAGYWKWKLRLLKFNFCSCKRERLS